MNCESCKAALVRNIGADLDSNVIQLIHFIVSVFQDPGLDLDDPAEADNVR